jgi:hypothetical protein
MAGLERLPDPLHTAVVPLEAFFHNRKRSGKPLHMLLYAAVFRPMFHHA